MEAVLSPYGNPAMIVRLPHGLYDNVGPKIVR